jgi:hypothetical protein
MAGFIDTGRDLIRSRWPRRLGWTGAAQSVCLLVGFFLWPPMIEAQWVSQRQRLPYRPLARMDL